jgi:hypothetical protein
VGHIKNKWLFSLFDSQAPNLELDRTFDALSAFQNEKSSPPAAAASLVKKILPQCLANPSVTSIMALSRRELPVSDPKLQTIIHADFSCSVTLLAEGRDEDAYINALGTHPRLQAQPQTTASTWTTVAARVFATNSDGKHESGWQEVPLRLVQRHV